MTSTYIISSEMMNAALGEHRIVLEFAFAERRSIAGNYYEFGLSRSKTFQCRFIAKSDLARFHHYGEMRSQQRLSIHQTVDLPGRVVAAYQVPGES